MPEEHLQIAVIDRVGIFRHAGIDELLQFPLQGKPVNVLLQTVWNLSPLQSGPLIDAGAVFLPVDLIVKSKSFAAFTDKPKRCRFQVFSFPCRKISRLKRSGAVTVNPAVVLTHGFHCRISHNRILSPNYLWCCERQYPFNALSRLPYDKSFSRMRSMLSCREVSSQERSFHQDLPVSPRRTHGIPT